MTRFKLKNLARQESICYGYITKIGLHYPNDLAKLWNSGQPQAYHTKPESLMSLSPRDWVTEMAEKSGEQIAIYYGQKPAQALDQLLKGPTTIDCGMYTQLCFWFRIRCMLGNERFNRCFGRAPLFITQYVDTNIRQVDKPFLGNPLYAFFSTLEQAIEPGVNYKYLRNHRNYGYKHPDRGDYF